MKFSFFYFIVGFFIGFVLWYIFKYSPKIIIKQPDPNNSDGLLYKDEQGVCYRYRSKNINCPNDTSNLIKF